MVADFTRNTNKGLPLCAPKTRKQTKLLIPASSDSMVQPSWKESIDPVVSKFFRRSHVAMALTLLALFIACGAVSPTGRHGAHAIVNAVVHAAELPTGHTPSQSSDDGQPKGPT